MDGERERERESERERERERVAVDDHRCVENCRQRERGAWKVAYGNGAPAVEAAIASAE